MGYIDKRNLEVNRAQEFINNVLDSYNNSKVDDALKEHMINQISKWLNRLGLLYTDIKLGEFDVEKSLKVVYYTELIRYGSYKVIDNEQYLKDVRNEKLTNLLE